MQGGFSFCGIDIADIGLEYAPELADTYVFSSKDYSVQQQTFDAHDGGYFYGISVQPKKFTLRCIYQDTHINEGIITKIERLFRRGRTGRLIFKKRPWMYYVATVTKCNVSTITNYLNGITTIEMTAYYPYGRCDDLFYPDDTPDEKIWAANSNMQPASQSIPTSVIASGEEKQTQFEFMLHNGGTENASVAIELAGDVGNGVQISNATTGKKSSFVALTKELSSSKGLWIVSDGISGRTVLTDGVQSVDASLYHDFGFIDLAPSEILHRNLTVSLDAASNVASLADSAEETFDPDVIGAQLLIGGSYRNVLAWASDDHKNVKLNASFGLDGNRDCCVLKMNRIVVTPASTMALTKLNFVYKPTFS